MIKAAAGLVVLAVVITGYSLAVLQQEAIAQAKIDGCHKGIVTFLDGVFGDGAGAGFETSLKAEGTNLDTLCEDSVK